MKYLLFFMVYCLLSCCLPAEESFGSFKQIESDLRADFPFPDYKTGDAVTLRLVNKETVCGRVFKVTAEGVFLKGDDGWDSLYKKENMLPKTKACFYKDEYESYIKSTAMETYNQKEAIFDKIKEENIKAEKEKLDNAKKLAEKEKDKLSECLYGYKIVQITTNGILAMNSDENIVLIVDMPKSYFVDGDLVFNDRRIIEEPVSTGRSDRLSRVGGSSGAPRRTVYQKREEKFLRVWPLGTYSYANGFGGQNTVRKYTVNYEKYQKSYKK